MDKINIYSGDKFPMLRKALEIFQDTALLAATSAQIGGEGKPHENRMPYIVFAKIIKVR